MDDPVPRIVAGLPEMWQPVYTKYTKYKPFFDCAAKIAPIVTEMTATPVQGRLFQIVGRMAAAAANTHGALLTLVLNGYGHDAMKLARSLFEIEMNIIRLKDHPDEIEDFMGYHLIQQKQLSGAGFLFTKEPGKPARLILTSTGCSTGRHPLFTTSISVDLPRIRTEICLPIWRPPGRPCMMRLWQPGCALRAVNLYDEIARLGFKDRIESGPITDYVAACKIEP